MEHQSKIRDLPPPHLIVSCVKFSLHQFCFFIDLNYQIKSVKEQQDEINAKLHADYVALEEQISDFDLEVRVSRQNFGNASVSALLTLESLRCDIILHNQSLKGHVVCCRNIPVLLTVWGTQKKFRGRFSVQSALILPWRSLWSRPSTPWETGTGAGCRVSKSNCKALTGRPENN